MDQFGNLATESFGNYKFKIDQIWQQDHYGDKDCFTGLSGRFQQLVFSGTILTMTIARVRGASGRALAEVALSFVGITLAWNDDRKARSPEEMRDDVVTTFWCPGSTRHWNHQGYKSSV